MHELTKVIDGDAYIEVLLRRQATWLEGHAQNGVWWRYPVPVEYFVRDEDAAFVRIPEPAPKPTAPAPKQPRRYRTAETLRAEPASIKARMAAVAGRDTTDPAAVNLSPHSRNHATASADRCRFAALDHDLEIYAHLGRRRDALTSRIPAAERRKREEQR